MKALLMKSFEGNPELKKIISNLIDAHGIYLDFGVRNVEERTYFEPAMKDGKSKA